MDLYLFDFDKTLYRYDFRQRLPALAEPIGASQYHLAKSWRTAGYEARAERGEWREARLKASTPIPGSVAALERATTLGMHAHHFTEVNGEFQVDALNRAMDDFAGRRR